MVFDMCVRLSVGACVHVFVIVQQNVILHVTLAWPLEIHGYKL